MYVDVYDDLKRKLTEYKEVILTMRLEIRNDGRKRGIFQKGYFKSGIYKFFKRKLS